MDIAEIVLAVLAVSAAVGSFTTAVFFRKRGIETIKLLQINIKAYKDAEKLKDQRIAYLEGQLVIKDETIKRILTNDKR